jgi:beta-glucosidase
MDALVASWLPGSEGSGVADVLFGRRPFTGRLSMTWPASADQVPINVGDATYRPLYPYGWGLRTDPGRARLAAAAGDRPTPLVRSLLATGNWQSDGSLRADPRTLRLAGKALSAARHSAAVRDAILSVVRDAAQAAVVSGRGGADAATLLAEADHAQATGADAKALGLLTRVAGS